MDNKSAAHGQDKTWTAKDPVAHELQQISNAALTRMSTAGIKQLLKIDVFTASFASLLWWFSTTTLWMDLAVAISISILTWRLSYARFWSVKVYDAEAAKLFHSASQTIVTITTHLTAYLAIKTVLTIVGPVLRHVLLHPETLLTWRWAAVYAVVVVLALSIDAMPTLVSAQVNAICRRIISWFWYIVIAWAGWYAWAIERSAKISDALLEIDQRQTITIETSRYDRIKPGQFRLLRLKAKTILGGIRGELITVDLSAPPQYEAISWTWGDQQAYRYIRIDGKSLRVTRSAWDTLNACASYWSTKLVWIDQICINQTDELEKGEQVAQMFNIYSSAKQVIAYLGPSPAAGAALSALTNLMWLAGRERDVAELYGVMSMTYWPALWELLRHPWFQRVWIVQEVAASKRLVIAYGGYMIDWLAMIDALRFMVTESNLYSLYRADVETTLNLNNIMELVSITQQARIIADGGIFIELAKSTEAYSLPSILGRTARFKATDPRDKIYALQAVSLPTVLAGDDVLEVDCDYQSSAAELYIEFAALIISRFPDPYYMMNYAGLCMKGELDLPSWVPDWTNYGPHAYNTRLDSDVLAPVLSAYEAVCKVINKEPYDLNEVKEKAKTARYMASGTSKAVCVCFEEGSARLAVRAVKVGKIKSISRVKQPNTVPNMKKYTDSRGVETCPDAVKESIAWLQDCRRLAADVYEAGSDELEDVLWRSLVGDKWQNMRPAPEDAKTAYEAWEYSMQRLMECFARVDAGEQGVDLPYDDAFTAAQSHLKDWFTALGSCAVQRALCCVENQYIGVVPSQAEIGDLVVIPLGASAPWVLRSIDKTHAPEGDVQIIDGHYHLVGECYVHGVMDGELISSTIVKASKTARGAMYDELRPSAAEEKEKFADEPQMIDPVDSSNWLVLE